MASIMQRAIDIDDVNSASQEERVRALLIENRGLKEILAVHENMHHPKHATTTMSIPEMIPTSSQSDPSPATSTDLVSAVQSTPS
jgi:SIKE family